MGDSCIFVLNEGGGGQKSGSIAHGKVVGSNRPTTAINGALVLLHSLSDRQTSEAERAEGSITLQQNVRRSRWGDGKQRDSSEIGARGLGGHSYVTSKINSPFPLSFIKPLSNFWVLFLLQFETLYEHSTTERDDEEKEEVGIRYFPISLPPSLSLARSLLY